MEIGLGLWCSTPLSTISYIMAAIVNKKNQDQEIYNKTFWHFFVFLYTSHQNTDSIQHYGIKVCQWLPAGVWFSPGTPVFFHQ